MSKMIHNKYFLIMKEFLRGYKREIYGRDLIGKVKLSQKNIALTLIELEKDGILSSKLSGNRKYYSLNFLNSLIKDFIVLFEYYRKLEFLEKNKKLIDFSEKLQGEIVCIFGSYAKERVDKDSDLDVLIIGKSESSKIRNLGKQFGVKVQVFNLSLADFKKQIKNKSALILEILENHVLIKGADKFVKEVLDG